MRTARSSHSGWGDNPVLKHPPRPVRQESPETQIAKAAQKGRCIPSAGVTSPTHVHMHYSATSENEAEKSGSVTKCCESITFVFTSGKGVILTCHRELLCRNTPNLRCTVTWMQVPVLYEFDSVYFFKMLPYLFLKKFIFFIHLEK